MWHQKYFGKKEEPQTAERNINLKRILSEWYRRDDYSTDCVITDIYDQFRDFAIQKHLPTDEQVTIYFNNHSSILKDQTVKIPVMTRSDVIQLVKWIKSQIK